jgi:hypothetical protein
MREQTGTMNAEMTSYSEPIGDPAVLEHWDVVVVGV